MVDAKKTAKPVKTYMSIKGLLSAKTRGMLPRGVKVDHSIDAVEFTCGDVVLLRVDAHDFVEDAIKRLGFAIAKS